MAGTAAAAWDGLDVVMNVAGFLRPAEVRAATDDDVHRHFDVNVKGCEGNAKAFRSFLEGL